MENENTALALPDEATFRRDITAINRFQQVAHQNMIPEVDFGVIPGTSKPTLLKPGAEKIAKLLGLSDQYEILDRQEDWSKPFFRYLIKCSLVSVSSGVLISEGLGECNSMESKYRWRETKRKCPVCGAEAIIKGKNEYGGGWICFKKTSGCGAKWEDGAEIIESQKAGKVENDDIYSQVNTILKMSKKRALVDAALSAGRLSQVFTQDMEDLPHEEPQRARKTKPEVIGIEQPEPSSKPTTEPNKQAPVEKEETIESKLISSKDKLYAFVAENMNWKNTTSVKSWLVNKCKIEAKRIDAEPEAVLKEVRELQGWSLPE